MNINRYNYEEFFLLYVDNELTKAEREEVETFVHDNPDLEEELVMLKQSKLRPDSFIKFQGIESLLKPESSSFINESNYEEFFLLYVDGELNAAERREVEAFAATQPLLQQELNLLMQTKVEAENEVVFPDKSLLYKEESKKRPIIYIGWQRVVAVAAMMILALGIFWFTNSGKKQNNLATNGSGQQQKEIKKTPITSTKEQEQSTNITKQANQPQVAQQQKSNKPVNPIRNDEPQAQKEDLALNHQPLDQPLDQPLNTNSKPVKTAAVGLSGVDNNSASIATNVNAANSNDAIQVVVQPEMQVSHASYTDEDQGILFANITVDRKNKLRGLVRKVTRVFEKTTSRPASEKEY